MALEHQQLTHRSEMVSGALALLVPSLLPGAAADDIPAQLRDGLRDAEELEREIVAFSRIADSGRAHLLL